MSNPRSDGSGTRVGVTCLAWPTKAHRTSLNKAATANRHAVGSGGDADAAEEARASVSRASQSRPAEATPSSWIRRAASQHLNLALARRLDGRAARSSVPAHAARQPRVSGQAGGSRGLVDQDSPVGVEDVDAGRRLPGLVTEEQRDASVGVIGELGSVGERQTELPDVGTSRVDLAAGVDPSLPPTARKVQPRLGASGHRCGACPWPVAASSDTASDPAAGLVTFGRGQPEPLVALHVLERDREQPTVITAALLDELDRCEVGGERVAASHGGDRTSWLLTGRARRSVGLRLICCWPAEVFNDRGSWIKVGRHALLHSDWFARRSPRRFASSCLSWLISTRRRRFSSSSITFRWRIDASLVRCAAGTGWGPR